MHSCMLHGSETWPVKKENKLTLQQTEMRMIRWTCSVKGTDRFTCSELKEKLGTDDITTVIERYRIRWYGHVLRKDENDWVKKYTDFELEGVRPRGRPKKTCSEVRERLSDPTNTRALQPVATCRQLSYLHKPANIIMTSFSLWRHSRVLRAPMVHGARSPCYHYDVILIMISCLRHLQPPFSWRPSHYDVIRYWAGHAQRDGQTYVRYVHIAFNM